MERSSNGDLRQAVVNLFELNAAIVLAKVKVTSVADQERAVHELRVAIKKMRSVSRFVERFTEGDFDQKKEFHELKRLFRAAGGLRELQVHQGVLMTYEQIQVTYYKKVTRMLAAAYGAERPGYNSARKAFKAAYIERIAKKINKILTAATEFGVHAAIVAFARERLDASRAAMPSNYDPVRLHQARILLKEAMYMISLLHAAGYDEEFPVQQLVVAKEAAEIAGEWHDREVFGQWLQAKIQQGELPIGKEKGYSMLLQDLHMHTRSLARRFREAMEGLATPEPAT